MNLEKITNKELINVIRQYNLQTHISGYSKMKKTELIDAMKKHLIYENGIFTLLNKDIVIKHPIKIITEIKPVPKEKPDYELIRMSLPEINGQYIKDKIPFSEIADLIKRFVRNDIEDNKKYWQKSLIYSLDYYYNHKELYHEYLRGYYYYEYYNETILYLKHNIDEMNINKETKKQLENILERGLIKINLNYKFF